MLLTFLITCLSLPFPLPFSSVPPPKAGPAGANGTGERRERLEWMMKGPDGRLNGMWLRLLGPVPSRHYRFHSLRLRLVPFTFRAGTGPTWGGTGPERECSQEQEETERSEVDDEATRTWPIGREKDRTIRNPKEPKRLRTKWDWKWRILIIQLFSYPVNLDPTISPLIKSYPNA